MLDLSKVSEFKWEFQDDTHTLIIFMEPEFYQQLKIFADRLQKGEVGTLEALGLMNKVMQAVTKAYHQSKEKGA